MDSVLIPLTNGKSAIIDAEDLILVDGLRWVAFQTRAGIWYARAYIYEKPRTIWLQMHRVLMAPPLGVDVDHIDGDGLNNRRTNLRLATRSQNLSNGRMQTRNTSGFKGVTWDKSKQKWQAQMSHEGRHIFLGRFDDPVEAARAYDAGARFWHGPFARCNFPAD